MPHNTHLSMPFPVARVNQLDQRWFSTQAFLHDQHFPALSWTAGKTAHTRFSLYDKMYAKDPNLDTPRRSGCGEWHGPHRNISHPRCGLLHKSSFTCGASCVASKRTHYCLSGSRTMVKIVQIRSIFDIFATHSANLIKHGRGNFRVGQAFIVMKIYLRYFQGKHCGIMLWFQQVSITWSRRCWD